MQTNGPKQLREGQGFALKEVQQAIETQKCFYSST